MFHFYGEKKWDVQRCSKKIFKMKKNLLKVKSLKFLTKITVFFLFLRKKAIEIFPRKKYF